MDDQTRNADHLSTKSAAQASNRVRTAAVLAGGVVVAAVGNVVIAVIAHAAGASTDFKPLHVGTFLPLTVIGFLAGMAGWTLIRAKAKRPSAILRPAVPLVVVLSFVPDILVLASGSQQGVSTGAVIGLMLMHVMVTVAAVPAFVRALPLPDASKSSPGHATSSSGAAVTS